MQRRAKDGYRNIVTYKITQGGAAHAPSAAASAKGWWVVGWQNCDRAGRREEKDSHHRSSPAGKANPHASNYGDGNNTINK